MKASTIILIIIILLALGISLIVYLPKDVLQAYLDKKYKIEPVQTADSLKAADGVDTDTNTVPPNADFGSLLEAERAAAAKNREAGDVIPHYEIEVQKSAFLLTLFRDGEVFQTYNIAVGNKASDKLEADDMVTPLGNFYIVSIEQAKGRKSNCGRSYGPWLIRLRTDQLVTVSGKAWINIGIHGDAKANEIGRSVDTDCVIMQNEDLKQLKDYIYNEYKHYHIPVRIVP